MKKVLAVIISIALLATLFVVPAYAEPENLLDDYDFFDTTMSSWGGWTTFEYDLDSHTDDGSGCITYGETTPHGHCSQTILFEAGVTYYASVWVKVSSDFAMNTAGFNGYCIGIGEGGSWGKQYGKINSNDDLAYEWTKISWNFSFEEDTETLFSLVCWGKSAGTVSFDDAYLGTEPEPITIEAAAGDLLTLDNRSYKFETKDRVYDELQENNVNLGWSYCSPNGNINFEADGFVPYQTSDGDGCFNMRNWGLGYSADPIVAEATFIATAAENSFSINLYGGGESVTNSFVKVVADGDTYSVQALDNDAYITVKTGVTLNQLHTITGVFVANCGQYLLALDGVVLGVYDYCENYCGSVATFRLDEYGYAQTLKFNSITLGTADYSVTPNTGDTLTIAVAVVMVALAATVLFEKKRLFNK